MKNKVKFEKLDGYFISILEDSNFFKLDCGLQNYDSNETFINALIASIAGFSAIDVNASSEVINATSNAIREAKLISKNYSIPFARSPIIFVSEKLSLLNKNFFELENKFSNFKKQKFDIFEIHVDKDNKQLLSNILLLLKKYLNDKAISINISREFLSNASVIEILKLVNSQFSNNFIVEVDGQTPTTHIYNSYNDTMQTISTADIINKELKFKEIRFSKIPLLLSGGINSTTREFAIQCGVRFNGITIKKSQLLSLKNIRIDNLNDKRNLNLISKAIENF
ncbi:hypothetical protein OA006_01525 [Prochlorococcus sp. AH-736-D21]|nr:hypothetical protein [Prochlorococcus sp. AH-736-D21]